MEVSAISEFEIAMPQKTATPNPQANQYTLQARKKKYPHHSPGGCTFFLSG